MDGEDDTDKTIDEKWKSIKTIIKETKQQLRKGWKHGNIKK
jgi:hypothetical protein